MSVAQRVGVMPVQRRIALVESAAGAGTADERTQHAMRLLDTMLWVLKGTTRDTWSTATPDEADIVVLHRNTTASNAAEWRARGKLVVEIVNDASAPGEHVLTYPFPAKRVLELLEKLSGQLASGPVTASAPAMPAPAAAPAVAPARITRAERWTLCESLRTLREVRNDSSWMIARDGAETVLWLRGDNSTCFATESLIASLRDASLVTRLELREGYPPPKARVIERPGVEFAWYIGFNADDAPAPWLSSTQAYRVTGWPDFGAIRPPPDVIRLVALLAQHSLDVNALAARGRVSVALAQRTLNALSMCEVLTGDAATAADTRATNIAAPPGGIAGFLRRIRRHLKLGDAT